MKWFLVIAALLGGGTYLAYQLGMKKILAAAQRNNWTLDELCAELHKRGCAKWQVLWIRREIAKHFTEEPPAPQEEESWESF